MSTAKDIQRSLREELSGRRVSKHPNFGKFCDDAACDISRALELQGEIGKSIEKMAPEGYEARERTARNALKTLKHALERMTTVERGNFFRRVSNDDVYQLLDIDTRSYEGLCKLHERALDWCDLTIAMNTTTKKYKSARQQDAKVARVVWIVEALARQWWLKFDDWPKSSSKSPFYYAVAAVCRAIKPSLQVPDPKTVRPILSNLRPAK